MMLRNPSENILICIVSYSWYQVLKANFISNGSSYTNCWYTKIQEKEHEKEEAHDIEPGAPILFMVEKDGRQMIVGGGYYFLHRYIKPEPCWYRYGVRAGALSYDSFLECLKERQGSMDEELSCYIATGGYMFSRSQLVDIPEPFRLDTTNKSHFHIGCDRPLGMYLYKVCNERRLSIVDFSTTDHNWPGIYYKATITKSYNRTSQYKTKLLLAYNRRCAVSGCTMTPVLEVAHIKTMYDDRYVGLDNGIILRADLHALFSKGMMTFRYKGANKIVVQLSRRMIEENAPYYELNGVELQLPKDRSLWPNKEYLEWHNNIRFENWLKYGEFSLIDKVPMHPKKNIG